MAFSDRVCRYFERPGSANTEAVIEAVSRRLEEGDVRSVVVASTSGRTGLKFAEKLHEKARIIVVSYEKIPPKIREDITSLGGVVVDNVGLPLHRRGMDKIRNTFYVLGQGFKVAVEVILIAVDEGVLKMGQVVIGVGGTAHGADTAIVAKASSSREMLGSEIRRRLEVREIIAMPVRKKWWE
ncbi:MAG: hypothetical protein L2C94_004305 [Aigarchaeota archaeon]|nr:hypothetical protein [Candidatus Wolframiiraptor gerlachensis]